VLEAIFEFLFEILLQIVLEVLAELGLHTVREPFRKRPHPGLAAAGYVLLGLLAGGLSLFIAPQYFVKDPWRWINLAVTPIVAGLAMMGVGAMRARRGQELVRLDRFMYGYLFALSLGLVRFLFAHP